MTGENNKCHYPIHVADAPKIDKNTDRYVVDFIDTYITCFLPAPEYNSEFYNLVKTLQTHSYTKTCHKKKGVIYRIGAPWPVTERTLMNNR